MTRDQVAKLSPKELLLLLNYTVAELTARLLQERK